MASQIILKSGTSSPAGILATAEPAIDLSTGKLYIGQNQFIDASNPYVYSDDTKLVMDASLGSSFVWDGGLLDVSVAGGLNPDTINGGTNWVNPTGDLVSGGTW